MVSNKIIKTKSLKLITLKHIHFDLDAISAVASQSNTRVNTLIKGFELDHSSSDQFNQSGLAFRCRHVTVYL